MDRYGIEPMQYLKFTIENYRAIKEELSIDVVKDPILPLIGINECGKTSILQAIYCFDYSNDTYSEGRHLKNVKNLYELSHNNSQAEISAELSVSGEEIKLVYTSYANTVESLPSVTSAEIDNEAAKAEAQKRIAERNEKIAERNGKIGEWWGKKRTLYITRQISEEARHYTNVMLDGKPLAEQLAGINIEISEIDTFVRELLRYGPHILYSDDFNDRPPREITIPKDSSTSITEEWQNIYDTLFKQSSNGLSLYSVANQKDRRVQESQLAHIESSLNGSLQGAWKTFLSEKEHQRADPFTIKLTIDTKGQRKKLRIAVSEKLQDNTTGAKSFDITDRSKGFIWYFTLIMKVLYNPKAHNQRSNSNTIFLLDEPGSYLHATAQSALCEQLKSTFQKKGTIIYCTHTPHLLNPKFIATHKVRIVEKDTTNNISIKPPALGPSERVPASEKPLLEALHLPYMHSLETNRLSVLVEGIYDAYVLRLIIQNGQYFSEQDAPNVVPASGAHSIIQLLSYFVGFRFDYVAVWDNDQEGQKKRNKAVKEFGSLEEARCILLPRTNDAHGIERENTTMEGMFMDGDIEKIATELDLNLIKDNRANRSPNIYNKTVMALFSASKKEQKRIIDTLNKETHNNFDRLFKSIIDKSS